MAKKLRPPPNNNNFMSDVLQRHSRYELGGSINFFQQSAIIEDSACKASRYVLRNRAIYCDSREIDVL
jgi:hypothetical protein